MRLFFAAVSTVLILFQSTHLSAEDPSENTIVETLKYRMEYLNLHVADLKFELFAKTKKDISIEKYLKVTAKSTGIAGNLFNVDNEYSVLWEDDSYLPVKIIKNIKQKNIEHHIQINFDHAGLLAVKDDSVRWSIPRDCFDYFSMLYFYRENLFEANDRAEYYLDSEFLISKIRMTALPERELIEVPAGSFPSFKLEIQFEPVTKIRRPWKTDILTNRLAKPGSKLNIWFSDDEHRVPLKIEYLTSILSTKILLVSFE